MIVLFFVSIFFQQQSVLSHAVTRFLLPIFLRDSLFFFVERVMVITRELLSLSCAGPRILIILVYKKSPPKNIKWNKLSVFLFLSLRLMCVASVAASRSNSTKRISDVIVGCIWFCFFCIEVIYIRK